MTCHNHAPRSRHPVPNACRIKRRRSVKLAVMLRGTIMAAEQKVTTPATIQKSCAAASLKDTGVCISDKKKLTRVPHCHEKRMRHIKSKLLITTEPGSMREALRACQILRKHQVLLPVEVFPLVVLGASWQSDCWPHGWDTKPNIHGNHKSSTIP